MLLYTLPIAFYYEYLDVLKIRFDLLQILEPFIG